MRLSGYGGRARGDRTLRAGPARGRQGFVIFRVHLRTCVLFFSKKLGLPRKEVIQPHLPVRLPCYDFTPLTNHTFDTSLPERGWAGGFGCNRLGWCDGLCVQGPGTHSPRRADPRLLATPTSRRRVAASDPNWGRLWGFAPARAVAAHCAGHCSTCAAQRIRGMMT